MDSGMESVFNPELFQFTFEVRSLWGISQQVKSDLSGSQLPMRVGTISNMYKMVKLLLEADRIIRP